MHDLLRVKRFQMLLDARCLIEVDEYVPLRFRTYDVALGASYLRILNPGGHLIELLVDPNIGVLRGVTVLSYGALSPWPTMQTVESRPGLPVFDVPWSGRHHLDAGESFSVAVRDNDVLCFWRDISRCEASNFLDRVDFLTIDGVLGGIRFHDLSGAEIVTILRHSRPASP